MPNRWPSIAARWRSRRPSRCAPPPSSRRSATRATCARADVHARLPLTDFSGVFRTVIDFARDVQHLSGVPSHAVTAEIQSQAKALMDASMVLGDEGLTANQQAELRTMRERDAASLADAARGGGGKEKASPLRTDRPRSSHQNGSPARSKPTTPLSLAASIDAVTPSRSASVSANLIELTRQVRYPQLHDPWNGRNGPPPRRLPRAGSAPPIALRRPLDSTMPLAAPHLKSTATVEQIFNSSPFAFGSLAKFDKRSLKSLGLRPS